MFGRATIRLGIGPHSSSGFDFIFSILVKRLARKSISEMTFLCRMGYKSLSSNQWKRIYLYKEAGVLVVPSGRRPAYSGPIR